jgi:hypothetical protein
VLARYWGAIRQLIEAIRQFMALPPEPKQWGRIGFGRENDVSPNPFWGDTA